VVGRETGKRPIARSAKRSARWSRRLNPGRQYTQDRMARSDSRRVQATFAASASGQITTERFGLWSAGGSGAAAAWSALRSAAGAQRQRRTVDGSERGCDEPRKVPLVTSASLAERNKRGRGGTQGRDRKRVERSQARIGHGGSCRPSSLHSMEMGEFTTRNHKCAGYLAGGDVACPAGKLSAGF
jgi:hypothetical protein